MALFRRVRCFEELDSGIGLRNVTVGDFGGTVAKAAPQLTRLMVT